MSLYLLFEQMERGRMNLVTREKVLQGIAEVKEGITFCLSLPLDYPGGNVLNPRRSAPLRNDTVAGRSDERPRLARLLFKQSSTRRQRAHSLKK